MIITLFIYKKTGCSSTVSKLQSYYKKIIYFVLVSLQNVLVLI